VGANRDEQAKRWSERERERAGQSGVEPGMGDSKWWRTSENERGRAGTRNGTMYIRFNETLSHSIWLENLEREKINKFRWLVWLDPIEYMDKLSARASQNEPLDDTRPGSQPLT
jgi:hypothetical protein